MDKITLLKTFLAASVAGGFALSANAQTIIADNFDGYADQAAFEAVWAPSGTSGSLSAGTIDHPAGTTMNTRAFNLSGDDVFPTDANKLVWSYSFFDHGDNISEGANVLGRSYSQLWGRDSGGALAQIFSFGLWNALTPKASDGETSVLSEARLYYSARVAFGADNWVLLDTGPERSEGWQNFEVRIGSTEVEYFINGASVYSQTYTSTEGSIGFYHARLGSGLSSSAHVAYDNYNLEVIPEPSTYAAIFGGLALLGAFVYRRRLSVKK